MNYDIISQQLKALANPHRLKIVSMLSDNMICACDILEAFDFTQPTLSHHMKVLESNHLIYSEPRGKWTYYSLATPEIMTLVQDLIQIVDSEGAD